MYESERVVINHGKPSVKSGVRVGNLCFIYDEQNSSSKDKNVIYVLCKESQNIVVLPADSGITSANELISVGGNRYDYSKIFMADSGERVVLVEDDDIGKEVNLTTRSENYSLNKWQKS